MAKKSNRHKRELKRQIKRGILPGKKKETGGTSTLWRSSF